MCGNYHGHCWTCYSTHYIRADAIEQVVILELRHLSKRLCDDDESFAALLANKTNEDILKEKNISRVSCKSALHAANRWRNCVSCAMRKCFGQAERRDAHGIFGKIRSGAVKAERENNFLPNTLDKVQQINENFITVIRKFMRMNYLTAPLLRELINRIDVYEVTGTGKAQKQQIRILYNFVGYLELPSVANRRNYRKETQKDIAVEYIPTAKPA